MIDATPTVKVGQIWQDNDPRSPDRYLFVTATDATHAAVRQVAYNPITKISVPLPGVRGTRIRLDRFRPTSTGYRYVGEAAAQ